MQSIMQTPDTYTAIKLQHAERNLSEKTPLFHFVLRSTLESRRISLYAALSRKAKEKVVKLTGSFSGDFNAAYLRNLGMLQTYSIPDYWSVIRL